MNIIIDCDSSSSIFFPEEYTKHMHNIITVISQNVFLWRLPEKLRDSSSWQPIMIELWIKLHFYFGAWKMSENNCLRVYMFRWWQELMLMISHWYHMNVIAVQIPGNSLVCLIDNSLFRQRIKQISKLCIMGHLWGKSTGNRNLPSKKGQWRGKHFHAVTSSWFVPMTVKYAWRIRLNISEFNHKTRIIFCSSANLF